MRILVTGGAGYLGRPALQTLVDAGAEVHALSRRERDGTDGVVWHQADVLSPEVARVVGAVRAEALLHLAWCTEPNTFWSTPENVRWLAATTDLAQAFIQAGGRRMTVAGTCAEYDWAAGWCREASTEIAPATLYGSCKAAAHMALKGLCDQAGVDLAWGRIFHLFGPGEPEQKLVASVVTRLLAGQPVALSSGAHIRDYTFSADVGGGLATLALSDAVGAYNIASGQPRSVREVVLAAADLLGRPDLLRFGQLPDRAGDPPVLAADVGAMTAATGWQAPSSLEEGMQRTIAWWRREGVA